MNPDVAWAVWSGERQRRIEHVLERLLPPADARPVPLHRAMRYAVLGGGKRVRPLLVYAAGEVTGAAPEVADVAAAAIELVHAYSLVHDDLPCMDDDTLRRGRPTCHVAFGEATALLAGDALQALAFEILAAARIRDPAARSSGGAEEPV
jgi:farnesyl diphosphate synthase